MRVYVVSDVHGDAESLNEALCRARIFDNHGEKDPDAFVVQIGDLANCVEESVDDDLRCLDMVGREIDLMLVGNHEIPYFDPQNRFSGFYYSERIRDRLHYLRENDLLESCALHNGILISHAGISQEQLGANPTITESQIRDKLRYEWQQGNYSHYWLSDIGKARYGPAKTGGILWCDFDREFEPTSFPQIVGHTVGNLRFKGNTLCIDTIRNTGLPTVMEVK